MSQLSSARLQSDVAVAEMANLYLADPLLKPFSVPRLVVSEASVDLKVPAKWRCVLGPCVVSACWWVQLLPLLVVCVQLAIDTVSVGATAIATLAQVMQPVIKQSLANHVAMNVSSTLASLNANAVALQASSIIANAPFASIDNTTYLLGLVRIAATQVSAAASSSSSTSTPATRDTNSTTSTDTGATSTNATTTEPPADPVPATKTPARLLAYVDAHKC